MRAAIYTRISADPYGEQTATHRQELACRQLCEMRGWQVAEVFEDTDVSAFRPVDRPAFTALRSAVVCGDVEVVVCWKLDRLVRRPAEFEAFWTLADQSRVAIVSATEPIDTSSDLGLALVRVLVAFASMESATSGLRIRARLAERASTGMAPTGGKRAFGHTRDRVSLVEDEVVLVREAAGRVLEGASMRSIVMDWRRRGIHPTSGGEFSPAGLRSILISDRVVGDRTHRGEVVARDCFPAILDRLTHQRVREILTDPSRRNGSGLSRFLLSRGLLQCSRCGLHLRVTNAGVATPGRRKYHCSAPPHGCGRISVLMEIADEVISNAVIERCGTWNMGSDLGRPSYAPEEEAMLLAAIAETSRRAHELSVDFYVGHMIDRDEFASAHQILARRLHRLRRRLRSPALHLLTGSNPKSLRDRWDDLTIEDRRLAIGAMLDHAVVLPGSVQVGKGPESRFRFLWRDAGNTTSHRAPQPPRTWTEQTVIASLKRWAADGGDGRIASYREWIVGRDDLPGEETVKRHLRTWRNAMRVSGVLLSLPVDAASSPGRSPSSERV